MSLARLTVRRPVATTMAAVCAFLFGVLSIKDVPLDLLPDLTYPAITIEVPFPGSSPQEVESLLARPIEDAVSVSQGLVRLRSSCLGGQARIALLYRWGTQMDLAALEAREKLQRVELPAGAGTPTVLRFDPTLDPILRFGITLPKASQAELVRLRRMAEDRLKPVLERLGGVAAARVRGGFEEEVRVWVDPRAAQLEGITLDEVVTRLQAESVNLAGGVLREGRLEYRVRTLNELRELDQLRKTVVARRGEAQVTLGQLAQVVRGTADRELVTRLDGREAIEVAVFKASGQNTVAVASRVMERIKKLQRPGGLLAGAKVVVTSDQSYFIRNALDDLASTAWWGALFATLVLLLFLNDLRATLIIAFAIPLSLMATFLLMRVFEVSLNVMSLSGIALAIGMLVDNAIVVLEAIAKQREQGTTENDGGREEEGTTENTESEETESGAGGRDREEEGTTENTEPEETESGGGEGGLAPLADEARKPGLAAEQPPFPEPSQSSSGGDSGGAEPPRESHTDPPAVAGTQLVARAVIASTLTTLTVFVPVAFVEGIAGRLFRDQAMTLAFALLASLVASLSVIPMLAATQFLSGLTDLVGRGARFLLTPLRFAFDRTWDGVMSVYPRLLAGALNRPGILLAAALGITAGTFALGARLGADFLPEMHAGVLSMEVALPQGSSLRQTDSAIERLARSAIELPEVRAVFTTAGAIGRPGEQDEVRESVGQLMVRLKRSDAGDEASVEAALRQLVEQEPGLLAPVFHRPGLVSVRAPLEVVIDGRDLTALKAAAERVAEAVGKVPGVIDVRSSARGGRPEVRISLDRRKLAQNDLDAARVSQALEIAVRGRVSTDLVQSDRDVPIRVQLDPGGRTSLASIERIVVSSSGATPIALRSVGTVALEEGPAEIRRDGQRRVAVVSAEVAGRDLAGAVADVRAALADLPLPPALNVQVGGSANDMSQAFRGLALAIGLAILLVYLILAAQFESFLHPLIILGAVPLAGAGAAFGLWATQTPLSVVVLIGGVVLAGIVVNNAILLVDRINQLRQELRVEEAIRRACEDRLRPIVMTTATTVLGLLPLVIAPGEGAELRAPLAITVVSGLLGSTLLTLVVVPCAYQLLERAGRKEMVVHDPV